MSDRRSFLRNLAALPLLGGSLALIGQPTAAAVPVTDALLARYLAWLQHEHAAALREFNWRSAVAAWRPGPNTFEPTAEAYAARCERNRCSTPSWWLTDAPDVVGMVAAEPSSSRAAVVLSAAGVPIIGGRYA